jgi:trans-aconitate 2-methyltransferase
MSEPKLSWKPEVYLNFAAYRARPVADLLPRLHPPDDGALYDLGCGPGNVTIKLKARWPARAVIGVDSSPEMLDAARQKHGADGIAWEHGDIGRWQPSSPAGMIFANAALHWVPDHESLFPHLAQCLAPGGVLAVQMPLGQRARYHTCIDETAQAPRWRERLKTAYHQTTPLTPGAYYDLLAPYAGEIDIWETDYHHVLDGEDPVAAWAAGTALVPYTSLLDKDEAEAFTAAYARAVRIAYPQQKDGRTLFCMRRIFIVARRNARDRT